MEKFVTKTLNSSEKKNTEMELERSINDRLNNLFSSSEKSTLKEILNENMHLSYMSQFLSKTLADDLLKYCESNIKYYDGDLTKVRLFNKWHKIPRKQIAFGDFGLTYKFSGISLPAQKWTSVIEHLKNCVSKEANCDFNFVLVNRYYCT